MQSRLRGTTLYPSYRPALPPVLVRAGLTLGGDVTDPALGRAPGASVTLALTVVLDTVLHLLITIIGSKKKIHV